jgi:hypothetical protein
MLLASILVGLLMLLPLLSHQRSVPQQEVIFVTGTRIAAHQLENSGHSAFYTALHSRDSARRQPSGVCALVRRGITGFALFRKATAFWGLCLVEVGGLRVNAIYGSLLGTHTARLGVHET